MKKIFLTWSTSYLWSRFIELFKDRYEIFGVSRLAGCDLLDFDTVSQKFNEFQPDIIIHLAANLGRDSQSHSDITQTNPAITQHLLSLAKERKIPFVFTSTEAVYGWREDTGNYNENDTLQPRSEYWQSKVLSEALIKESGLPYLITRAHRYIGVNTLYSRPKQFPDILSKILLWEEAHLDAEKIFTPVHIDHLAHVIDFYIANKSTEKILMNIGSDVSTTFYTLMKDISHIIWVDSSKIYPDGEEKWWPLNSSLDISLLKKSEFPKMSYEEMLFKIKADILS